MKEFKSAVRHIVFVSFAKRFVAGETMEYALNVARRLNREEKKRAIINILGEHEKDAEKVLWILGEYLRLLKRINAGRLNASISVKLTQLGLDIDYNFCYTNVKQIAEEAEKLGIEVEIDMESSRYTQRTINLFLTLLKEHKNLRIAFQARLKRTKADLEKLLNAGAKIRLCKGAYKESADLAYQRLSGIIARYLILMPKLLKDSNFQAIATHDPDLIDLCTEAFGWKKREFEFQMLLGIRKDLQDSLVKDGYNVAVYVPYGKDFMAYGLRRLPTLLQLFKEDLIAKAS